MERRTVYYAGHVQGVGFRFAVRQAATGHAVSGFVRNLTDGRVEVVVEGTTAEIDRFLAAIKERMADYIGEARQTTIPATGEFLRFEIRR